MMTICPVCGKNICVHWPEHWVYKRRDFYFCSENCMMIFDTREYQERVGWIKSYAIRKKGKKEMKSKLTQAQKDEAVQIAINGGNPLPFLKECGSDRPDGMWWTIKNDIKKNNPELFDKLPKRVNLKKQVETPEGEFVATVNVDCQLNIETETPEQVKITKTVETTKKEIKLYKVSGIRTAFGEFYFDQKFNSIDWRTEEGDEVGMAPEAWKNLANELKDILAALGVEL